MNPTGTMKKNTELYQLFKPSSSTPLASPEQEPELLPVSEVSSPNPQPAPSLKFGPYHGSTLPEWIGFYRSVDKNLNKRHSAQCRSCLQVMQARIDQMRKHKSICNKMPENVKAQVTCEKKEETVKAADKTIPGMFLDNESHQDQCDYLMAMFIITSDISFR